MEQYFNKGKVKALSEILEKWLGTPWRHKCCKIQVGCDCVHFIIGVFNDLGVKPKIPIKIPEYPPDWHLHNTRELLREAAHKFFNVREFPIEEIQDGDVILSHFGQAASHAGFYVNGFVYHCVNPGGVSKGAFDDSTWRNKMRFTVRLMA